MELQGWTEASDGFSRYLITRGRSVNTAITYAAHLRPFWAFCLEREMWPSVATPETCERYHDQQLATVARSTAHVRLASLKAYYGWLMDKGSRKDDPTTGLKVKKGIRQPRPPFSKDDMNRLLAHADTMEERLLFIIGFGCGLRISELTGLNTSHVFYDTGRILIKGKGEKERWIAPPTLVLDSIRAYMGKRRGPIFSFTARQARRIMMRVADNAGVEGFYAHRMRITFATEMWKERRNLKALRLLMGHADLSTTAHYADYETQDEALDEHRAFGLLNGA